MTYENYNAVILVKESTEKCFGKIAEIGKWWAKEFTGAAQKEGDKFRVVFDDTWISFQVIETNDHKRLVWYVTDCYLHWLNEKMEWKGTTIVWSLSSAFNITEIDMTHIGLIRELEGFEVYKMAWNRFLHISLLQFIKTGKGQPE